MTVADILKLKKSKVGLVFEIWNLFNYSKKIESESNLCSVIEMSISSIIMHLTISMTILDDKYLPNIFYHQYNVS